jgi:hypothetical protein
MSSLSKMSSLNRRKRHMEEISAEQALWEAKIRMVQDSTVQQDTLCVFHNMVLDEVAEKEQEMTKLSSDMTKLSSDISESSSESESLDRHQVHKLEQISKDRRAASIVGPPCWESRTAVPPLSSSRESRAAVLQGWPDAFQTTPSKLSLSKEQIARLEHKAVSGQGRVADLPQLELGLLEEEQARPAARSQRTAADLPQLELGPFQLEQARPAAKSERAAAEPKARQDDMMGSLRSGIAHLQELPKILTVGRAQVEEMKVASTRIAELEKRLARGTQEMLKGPAVGKEVVTKPFGAIPEDQGMLGPWSPRGCLYTPRGYPSGPAAALDF